MKGPGLLKSNRKSRKTVVPREDTIRSGACPKCQGMMVADWVFTEEGEIAMARCIRCGDMIDSVVLFNRSDSRTVSSSDDDGRKKSRRFSTGPAKIRAA